MVILITSAILFVLIVLAIIILNIKQNIAEEQIEQIEDLIDKKVSAVDAEVLDGEIEMIIARLEQITADIAELDKEHISDHRDLVDIRTRYINYREPIVPNGGVHWADEHKCEEDK